LNGDCTYLPCAPQRERSTGRVAVSSAPPPRPPLTFCSPDASGRWLEAISIALGLSEEYASHQAGGGGSSSAAFAATYAVNPSELESPGTLIDPNSISGKFTGTIDRQFVCFYTGRAARGYDLGVITVGPRQGSRVQLTLEWPGFTGQSEQTLRCGAAASRRGAAQQWSASSAGASASPGPSEALVRRPPPVACVRTGVTGVLGCDGLAAETADTAA
jgi:hypothetical protein